MKRIEEKQYLNHRFELAPCELLVAGYGSRNSPATGHKFPEAMDLLRGSHMARAWQMQAKAKGKVTTAFGPCGRRIQNPRPGYTHGPPQLDRVSASIIYMKRAFPSLTGINAEIAGGRD
jgi:hypothetical protein